MCWYSFGSKVLSNKSLGPIPVEVGGGVPYPWQMNTSYETCMTRNLSNLSY